MDTWTPEREKRPGQLMVQVIAALLVNRLRFPDHDSPSVRLNRFR